LLHRARAAERINNVTLGHKRTITIETAVRTQLIIVVSLR